MLKDNVVLGLLHREPDCPDNYCAVCKNSREDRLHFGSSIAPNPPTAPLEFVHSDLMGPFECATLGGHLYTCSLYDQFTGYGEMFLLTAKSEVNDALRTAIYRWQRQSGRKIKVLRTDRGNEYRGRFGRFLRREGIIHQRSAAYTPEQNGVAERYNRTTIEKARCLLNEFEVPKFLWGEAINTAVHIRNLIPKTGQLLTPYELMFQKKPSVDHLRVFGCSAHVHIPKDQRKKTDPVSTTGMFVGYAKFSKAWRVLTWRSGKLVIIESASVTFAEHVSPSIHELNKHLVVPVEMTPFPDDDDFSLWG
jgi:transposase InsO family protein